MINNKFVLFLFLLCLTMGKAVKSAEEISEENIREMRGQKRKNDTEFEKYLKDLIDLMEKISIGKKNIKKLENYLDEEEAVIWVSEKLLSCLKKEKMKKEKEKISQFRRENEERRKLIEERKRHFNKVEDYLINEPLLHELIDESSS